ncbi:Arc family DNA-binding protein [Photobacterium phosphoreum]|uniref:Arc family DNA-binding protein n=1 Tax=Photobacterium phosphoreum TaxID=659 RepID=UPI003593F89B
MWIYYDSLGGCMIKKKIKSSYPLRMPTELRAWFEKEAVTNRRSLNSELVHVLEKEMKGVFYKDVSKE